MSGEQMLRAQAERAFARGLERGESGADTLALDTLPAKGVGTSFNCFPTCDANDGRFLVIAFGQRLVTLSDPRLEILLAVPADTTQFSLGFFDGDGTELDANGDSRWDLGNLARFRYTLFADPQANNTGTTVIEMLPGQPSIQSNQMLNNGWSDFAIQSSEAARAESGNFFYRLVIELTDADIGTDTAFNALKLRTDGQLTIETGLFSYIANFASLTDGAVIYPNLDPADGLGPEDLVGSTYDGSFDFFFEMPPDQDRVEVYDGDFDHGKWDGTENDTDDPNTSNSTLVPWATVDTAFEGVATGAGPGVTGDPPDDVNPASSQVGIFQLRAPSIYYDVVFPDGQTFRNNNPSGNREWEGFRIVNAPFDPNVMDAQVSSIPPGPYRIHIDGVDMQNLNALRAPFRVLCVDEQGNPCFPLLKPFMVGDTVYLDLDGDATQDAGEPGIGGVVMELVSPGGTVIQTATTDGNGNYGFGVFPGTYTVRVAAENFEPGGTLEGLISTTGDALTDTVVDENILDYDFGYTGNGSLGDTVWSDVNGDGVQDVGEDGVPGVTVTLEGDLNGDGVADFTLTTTTDGNGNYNFDDLPPGDYTVSVGESTLPAGLDNPTFDLDGTGTPHTASLELGPGEINNDVDFGYQGMGSIGDRVWHDRDGDGVQDPAEDGIEGVKVNLLDADGNVLNMATTDENGNYLFEGLEPGEYTVEIDPSTLPAGLDHPTFDKDGLGTPNSATVILGQGEMLDDVDFGYQGTGSLGDRVWEDVDGDGVQDVGEQGIPGVRVILRDADGNAVDSATTDANGNYTFDNLPAGDYTVEVDASTLPAGLDGQTFDLDGLGTPNTASVRLDAGENRTDVDFGYQGTGSLGDRVWRDDNGDGVQDAGEPGIEGVSVTLFVNGVQIESTMTDANGNYFFANLPAGDYTVVVAGPADLAQTFELDGTLDGSTTVSLGAGESRTDVDYGYQPLGSLGDRVWLDADGDGVQDAGEAGIEGVTVTLFDGAGAVVGSTTTDANGNYTFGDLPAGTYMVVVDSPANLVQTFELDDTLNGQTLVSLDPGENRTDVDYGYVPLGSLGDRVWLDLDGDGIQDAGEAGIEGVTVTLLDASGAEIGTATTDINGNYTFGDLPAGDYTVEVEGPADLAQTFELDGTLDGSTSVSLGPGQHRTDVDYGYQPLGSLGDRVWLDINGDGAQDPTEQGIAGVQLTLLDASGAVLGTATTDTNGNYFFTGLPAGDYTVAVTAPEGLDATFELDGTLDGSTTTSLGPGEDRTDVDFGFNDGFEPPLPPTIDPGDFRTQTQGGWGTRCRGNNPGCYRDANFPGCFADGLVIGDADGLNALFTSSSAIEAFLPSGGPAGPFTESHVDPTRKTEAGVLAGQVTALSLSVGFDACDADFGASPAALADLVVCDAADPCGGMSVAEILAEASAVLAGGGTFGASTINSCVSKINENFVDGTQDNGYLCFAGSEGGGLGGGGGDDDGEGGNLVGMGTPSEAMRDAILSPNGGEGWIVGKRRSLKWNPERFGGPVKIQLSRDGGVTYETLWESTSNDGLVRWDVTGEPSDRMVLRISEVANPDVFDLCDRVFSVPSAELWLVTPTGGEAWQRGGDKVEIRWDSRRLTGLLTIQLSRDGGQTWDPIGRPKRVSQGVFRANLRGKATDQAVLRIYSLSYTKLISTSETFVIE